MEKHPIEVHLHDTGGCILHEGPVVPTPLVIGGLGLRIDPVITAVLAAIPIHAAVAPRQVHVDHPLTGRIDALEERAVLRLALRVAEHPAFDRDLVGQPLQVVHIDFDAVRCREFHFSIRSARHPGLARTVGGEHVAVLHPIGLDGHVLQCELQDQVALAVPIDGRREAQGEAVSELPGGQSVLVCGVVQVEETGQCRIRSQAPFEVHPPHLGCPCEHGDEQPVDGAGPQGSELIRRPHVLGPLGCRLGKEGLAEDDFTGLHRGFGQDLIDEILGGGDVDRVLHAVDVRHDVGRIERGVCQQLQGVLQCGTVQHAGVVEEVGVAQVIPLAAGIAEVAGRAILEALQRVLHDDLAVLDPVVRSGEFEPATPGAVVGRGGIVLGLEGVSLHGGRVGQRDEGEKREGEQGSGRSKDRLNHGQKLSLHEILQPSRYVGGGIPVCAIFARLFYRLP